jgi:hypothetical protein
MINPSLPSAQRQPAQWRANAPPHEDHRLALALEAQAARDFNIEAAELIRSRTRELLEVRHAIADDAFWADLAAGRPLTRERLADSSAIDPNVLRRCWWRAVALSPPPPPAGDLGAEPLLDELVLDNERIRPALTEATVPPSVTAAITASSHGIRGRRRRCGAVNRRRSPSLQPSAPSCAEQAMATMFPRRSAVPQHAAHRTRGTASGEYEDLNVGSEDDSFFSVDVSRAAGHRCIRSRA